MENKFILRIAVVEDDEIYRTLIQERIKMQDNIEVTAYAEAKPFLADLQQGYDIVIVDYELPDMNGIDLLGEIKKLNPEVIVIVLSGQKELKVVVDVYKNGAERYIMKNDNAIIELIQNIESHRKNIKIGKELQDLKDVIIEQHKYKNIIGQSPAMMKVFQLMQKVENIKMPVLITGSNGTGKELVAKALHYNSDRSRNDFIAVNVAAIPEDLIESELFGSEKGAYTGATRRSGKFEEAHKGTIFLDEIGEMALPVQAKLLRVLQESKVTRLGGSKEIELDIRVLSATNKDLWKEVQAGSFREDLYFRLQGFIINLPNLSDRGNDIILLAKRIMEEFCKTQGVAPKTLHADAVRAMLQYSWPGNVRELKSMIERAVLISDGDIISEDDLVFLDAVQQVAVS